MNFRIVRDAKVTSGPTMGRLLMGGSTVQTLELPWLDNHANLSCIPEGTYGVVIAYSNRYDRLMPRLLDVPAREGVLVHAGNTSHDTKGCVLVGMARSGGALTYSKVAFNLFFDWLGKASRDGPVNVEVSYA
jgi:hypothetical protein